MKKILFLLLLTQTVINAKLLSADVHLAMETTVANNTQPPAWEMCVVCMGSKKPQNTSDRPDYRNLITPARQLELLTGCQSCHNVFFHEDCLRRVLRQKSACPICRAVSEQQEVILATHGTPPGATIYNQFIDAIIRDDREPVQLLSQQYIRLINMINHEGVTPLQAACQNNRLWVAQYLLANHAEVDIPNRLGRTSLHSAAYRGNVPVAQLLLIWRAQINMQCEEGFTPLHYASWQGHSLMVNFLLDAGADKTILDTHGRSAFDWSAKLDYPTRQRLSPPSSSICRQLTTLFQKFFKK